MQNIAKKFVEVMRDCSHVAKNGSNDFHKGVGYDKIGLWAWQLLAFLDRPPKDFSKANIRFVEER